MSSRDVDFAQFLDERGPALWRTASLLELNPLDAQQSLALALGHVRCRWSNLSRDGNAERAVRDRLYESVIGALPDAESPDDSVQADPVTRDSTERVALATLADRERLLLVLGGYEGLTEAHVANLLDLSVSEVHAQRVDAELKLRRSLGSPDNSRLLTILDAAALRDVPADLAERAASAPNGRSLRSGAAIAAVVTAAAVLVALSPWSNDTDAGGSATVNEWGVPKELPTADGRLTLGEAPIAAASTAYVVGGVPVVTDAATGSARLVFEGEATPEWFDDGEPGVTQVFMHAQWSQAVLSPNGKWLVLVQSVNQRNGPPTSHTFLVNLATATPTALREVSVQPSATGAAGIARTRVVWDPDSDGFACVCGRTLSIIGITEVDGEADIEVSHTPIKAESVAGGLPGLAVRQDDRGWWIVNRPSANTETLTHDAALAMTSFDRVLFFTVSPLTIYALGADSRPDGGRCTLWDSTFSEPTGVEPFPDQDGALCTPVTVQSGRGGIVLVVRPSDATARRSPLDIVLVNEVGGTSHAGEFPVGTTVASVAAQLVG